MDQQMPDPEMVIELAKRMQKEQPELVAQARQNIDPNANVQDNARMLSEQQQPPDEDMAMQYINSLRQQEGWDPDWDRYIPRLLYKMKNPEDTMTENIPSPDGRGAIPGIPAVDIAAIEEFANRVQQQ